MKMPNILAVLPHYAANAPRYLVDAFKKAGCQVIRCGPSYPEHMGVHWDDMPNVHMHLPKEQDWDLDAYLDICVRSWNVVPDFIFVSEENYKNHITPATKVPVVLWSMDGWEENFKRIHMIQPTLAYHSHPYGVRVQPRDTIYPGWKPLFGAAAPWVHQNYDKERDFDFVLFATMYGERPKLCEALKKRGIRVLSGQGNVSKYVEVYNSALCTLHNPQPSEIKWRFFEAAAMGCVNISWHTPLFDELGYKEWQHYIPIDAPEGQCDDPWPTAKDLFKRVVSAVFDPDVWSDVSEEAQALTLAENTYFHRIAKIFADLDMPHYADVALDVCESYVNNP